MQIKNRQQLKISTWKSPAQYWASPEGKRRKEFRRLDHYAKRVELIRPHFMN